MVDECWRSGLTTNPTHRSAGTNAVAGVAGSDSSRNIGPGGGTDVLVGYG